MRRLIVVMGVSGCGKSTLADALATRMGCLMLEADAFHPAANREKMAAGIALENADRESWIARIRSVVMAEPDADLVLACSALNAQVRHWLTAGLARQVHWLWLDIDEGLAHERVSRRAGHFMPASLVRSQFQALEPPRDAMRIDASQPVAALLEDVMAALNADNDVTN